MSGEGVITTALRHLMAAGVTGDALLAAVADMEAAMPQTVGRAAENKRAYDREYQRERRRNRTMSYESADPNDAAPAPNKSPPDPQKLTPTPPTHTGDAPARKAEPFPRPEWADPQVWSDLLANRRKKSLANTASAHRKLLADIDRLTDENWPPGRVLEAAVSRGWGAIYAGCKDDDDGRTGSANRGSGGRMGGPRPDPVLALVRAATEAQREDGRDHREARAALPPGQFG